MYFLPVVAVKIFFSIYILDLVDYCDLAYVYLMGGCQYDKQDLHVQCFCSLLLSLNCILFYAQFLIPILNQSTGLVLSGCLRLLSTSLLM